MLRSAGTGDLVALRDLERTASLVALRHVFPPEIHPYPDDDVLARWRLVLDEPGTTVLVVDGEASLAGLVAYDDAWLRHLAVHPDHWGRGLGRLLVERALHDMGLAGTPEASLWCLRDNHRARAVYEHLGWEATDDVREAPWPPYPPELRYARTLAQPER